MVQGLGMHRPCATNTAGPPVLRDWNAAGRESMDPLISQSFVVRCSRP